MSLSHIQKVRLEKAAVDEGFGLRLPDAGDWLVFKSVSAPASIRVTWIGELFVFAIDHSGVALELEERWLRWTGSAPDQHAAFAVPDTESLHRLTREAWRLSRSLPAEPLREYEIQTRMLPRSTETERLVVQRIGQDIFRKALVDYWGGACAVLAVTESRLLRASHIKPWSECDTDFERLDVFNGILLSAHLDAAFDSYLISFDDQGSVIISDQMTLEDRGKLNIHAGLTRQDRTRSCRGAFDEVSPRPPLRGRRRRSR